MKTPSGEVCTGTLTYRVSEEDDARRSKWIVTLSEGGGKAYRDLELEEREILRLVERRSGSPSTTTLDSKKEKGRQVKQGNVVSSSDSECHKTVGAGTQEKEHVREGESAVQKNSQFGSKQSQTKPQISEREKRRMRREAMLEEDQEQQSCDSPSTPSRKKRKMPQTQRRTQANHRNSKKNPKKRGSCNEPDEECVKIKMNTGTLYLYRGLNRRAVFVRRY